MPAWIWIIAVALGVVVFLIKVRSAFPGGLRAGDFFSVPIPRTADPPLAMGTRLDVLGALQKRGVARETLQRFQSGAHDQEMLDLYWAEADR